MRLTRSLPFSQKNQDLMKFLIFTGCFKPDFREVVTPLTSSERWTHQSWSSASRPPLPLLSVSKLWSSCSMKSGVFPAFDIRKRCFYHYNTETLKNGDFSCDRSNLTTKQVNRHVSPPEIIRLGFLLPRFSCAFSQQTRYVTVTLLVSTPLPPANPNQKFYNSGMQIHCWPRKRS